MATGPVLRVPLSQIDDEIGQQITLGRQLLDRTPSDRHPEGRLSRIEKMRAESDLYHMLEAHAKEVGKWDDYNMELLKRRFSTDQIANEYKFAGQLGGGGNPYVAAYAYRRAIETQILKLESIRMRLDLYSPAPTSPPAPTAAAIHIQGSVYGSPIQASSPGAHQTVSVGINLASVNDFLKEVEQAAPALNLPAQENQELIAEIATIRAQLQSPKPKKDIIRESLRSVRTILEGAGGSIVATGLLNTLQHIHF